MLQTPWTNPPPKNASSSLHIMYCCVPSIHEQVQCFSVYLHAFWTYAYVNCIYAVCTVYVCVCVSKYELLYYWKQSLYFVCCRTVYPSATAKGPSLFALPTPQWVWIWCRLTAVWVSVCLFLSQGGQMNCSAWGAKKGTGVDPERQRERVAQSFSKPLHFHHELGLN
jgi:hypothetical protein